MEAENRFILFLSRHWSKLVLTLLAVACVGAWTERFMRSGSAHKNQDFMLSQQMFDKFQQGTFLSAESLESVENILKRHPELHSKWDALLALTFFSQADAPKGIAYAQSMLNRTFGELPLPYQTYAETTLLLLEEKTPEAFESALALHKQIENLAEYQTLDAMNTLRLVFLAARLGDSAQKAHFVSKLQQHPAYPTLQPLFQEGTLSLSDYLQAH